MFYLVLATTFSWKCCVCVLTSVLLSWQMELYLSTLVKPSKRLDEETLKNNFCLSILIVNCAVIYLKHVNKVKSHNNIALWTSWEEKSRQQPNFRLFLINIQKYSSCSVRLPLHLRKLIWLKFITLRLNLVKTLF